MFSKNVVKNGASVEVTASQTDYSVVGSGTTDCFNIEHSTAFIMDAVCSGVTDSWPATASLNLTADITLTSVAEGAARNTTTFTTEVLAAAANPTDTVLAEFTGTSAAIVCTITPNDGTNNGTVAVDLTTEELVELINTGSVTGKTVTVTDASSLRILQTAAGGDTTPLANGGEGDSVLGTFSGGKSAGTGTLKLQVRFSKDQDWINTKSATVTADGTFTIKFLDTVAADQQYLPLRPQGRLVATTTSTDAFTVDAVYIQA